MRVAFSYLSGPVWGHRVRCQVLQRELTRRGHELVSVGYEPDWLVVDWPNHQIPVLPQARRLLMGQLPIRDADYAWHPLGGNHARTLSGIKYIIVDPELQQYGVQDREPVGILITCGASDPMHVTEHLLDVLPNDYVVTVVVGPHFNRNIKVPDNWTITEQVASNQQLVGLMQQHKLVLATWGTTVFEGLATGSLVIPITINQEQANEAHRLRMPFIKLEYLYDYTLARMIATTPRNNYGIDFQGAARTVDWLESI